MKKYLLALLVLGAIACTPTSINENDQSIDPDPDEQCPPNDRNCNGIPDDQE